MSTALRAEVRAAQAAPFVCFASTGNTVEHPNMSVSSLAPARVTGAEVSLLELELRPGCEPPPHRHTREDEAFYVLDGALDVFAGNQRFLARRGDCIFLPKNLPHAFAVRSPQARVLLLVSPPGFENLLTGHASPGDVGIEFVPDTRVSGPQPMAFLNRVAAGNSYWYATHLLTFLVNRYQSDGRYSLMQASARRGFEPPPHVHENEDEIFYLLNGVAEFNAGGVELHAAPGSCVFLPKGVPHSFRLLTPEATALILAAPGGIEQFFLHFSRPARQLVLPPLSALPPGYEEQRDAMTREGAKYGLRFV
ncbi:MAG: cupin domain-containing protein [Bryobacteraceae bacterium]|nr:cupin domain-containing protein [Bryobacteraceae bacterium]